MRWSGQELGVDQVDALPGLARLNNLVRSVQTPEFAGITFHEILAKSALNRVPGPSTMPFGWTINPYRGCSHACVYCLDPATVITMADGRTKPLSDVDVGDELIGTMQIGRLRRYVPTTVLAKWATRKSAYRISLADGTILIASGDHRFLTDRGWKYVTGAMTGGARGPYLTVDDRLSGFGAGTRVPSITSDDYRRGYLAGMIRGDAMMLERSRSKARDDDAVTALIEWPDDPSEAWHAGYLGGMFDVGGSCSRGVLRISNSDDEVLAAVEAALSCFDIPHVRERSNANGVANVRVRGGLVSRKTFFAVSRPATSPKLGLAGAAVKASADLRVVSIEPLGVELEMLDITTSTGDFIANGVVSHNCFARPTHSYLDLDAGDDFDRQIIVKVNVAEVLRRELARPSWRHESVALGTNTDPYQRAEGRYELMPGIIDELTASGTPFSVLTKGTLLRRDLPKIVEAAEHVPVDLAMSIAIYDPELQQSIEPGTPSTRARLATVTAVREAGLDCAVFLMPILPYLTDTRAHLDEALRQAKAAGASSVLYAALHLRGAVKPWFMQWLERTHPELVPKYRSMYYGNNAYAPKEYRRWLGERMQPLIRAHGLARGREDPVTGGVRSSATRDGAERRPARAGAELPPHLAAPSDPAMLF